jgi:hypothetical protein
MLILESQDENSPHADWLSTKHDDFVAAADTENRQRIAMKPRILSF